MKRIVDHVKNNLVGYLALFVALGGTSYAAVNLPAGSVGTAQLRNGAVTPAKLNGRTIGGSIRDWAFVNKDGTVISGSRGVHVTEPSGAPPYYVTWGDRFSHSCAVLASSPGEEGTGPIASRIGIHVNEPASPHGATVVWAWPSDNNSFINARFYVLVVC